MLLAELLEKEIDGQVELFESLWPGHADDDNPEPPHRQRTAVNKLGGYAMFLGIGRKRSPGLKGLRAWQKRLGPVRDLDVVRGWLGKAQREAGEQAGEAAAALHAELTARRAGQMEHVRPDAAGLPGATARVALQEARQELLRRTAALREEPDSFDRLASFRAVHEPWEEALAEVAANPQEALLHRFRVRNKRLRFVLELLGAEEKESGNRRRVLRDAGAFASRVHTALGNLSDLWMLRDELRHARQSWRERKLPLEASAQALEAGRAALEAREFNAWFDAWPVLRGGRWLARIEERLTPMQRETGATA